MEQLEFTRRRAPASRIRGKGRHFRQVLRDAEQCAIHPERGGPWDLWHYHADWSGFGNLGWRYRREYIRALGVVYGSIAAARERFQVPFQAFITLHAADAGSDAVYLHSPSPGGTPFPFRPKDIDWGRPLPHQHMSAFLPSVPFRCGTGQWAAPDGAGKAAPDGAGKAAPDGAGKPQRYFILYSPEVGLPLEEERA